MPFLGLVLVRLLPDLARLPRGLDFFPAPGLSKTVMKMWVQTILMTTLVLVLHAWIRHFKHMHYLLHFLLSHSLHLLSSHLLSHSSSLSPHL